MTSPNFFIVGAPQSGARDITGWLKQHPDVFFPGRSIENFHASDIASRQGTPESYKATYSNARARAVGECSEWYLYSDTAIPRILTLNPSARFVVCLRNPAEIVWRTFWAASSQTYEQVRDFKSAWALSFMRREGRGVVGDADPKLLDYQSIGALGSQLLRLTSRVNASNIHLVFLEDLETDPQRAWIDLMTFLDIPLVDPDNWSLDARITTRPIPALHRAVRKLTRPHGTGRVQSLIGRGIYRAFATINSQRLIPPEVPPEIRERLMRHYSDDVGLLAALCGRDLSDWVNC